MKKDLHPPQSLDEFFPWLKAESERLRAIEWLPGLTDGQIAGFEERMGFTFPEIYKMYLRCMNGTRKHFKTEHTMVRTYSPDGWDYYPERDRFEQFFFVDRRFHYFSYPRDITKTLIEKVCSLYGVEQRELEKKGIPHLLPIREDHWLVADQCETNPVLYIPASYNDDIGDYEKSWKTRVVADSLNNFLIQILLDVGDYLSKDVIDHVYSQKIFWLDERAAMEFKLPARMGDRRFIEVTEKILSHLTDMVRLRLVITTHWWQGRHPDVAMVLLQRIIKDIEPIAVVKGQPAISERQLTVVLDPVPQKG